MAGVNLSKKAALHMKKTLNLDDEQEEVVAYSVAMILHTSIIFFVICLIAWLFDCLYTALISTLIVSFLRGLSGGAHSESPLNCAILSVALAVAMGKASMVYGSQMPEWVIMLFIFTAFLISFGVMWFLAPVESPNKPITSETHRKQLRKLSLITIVFIFTLQSALLKVNFSVYSPYSIAAGLGAVWQSFTLTPAAHKFISKIDDISFKIKRR